MRLDPEQERRIRADQFDAVLIGALTLGFVSAHDVECLLGEIDYLRDACEMLNQSFTKMEKKIEKLERWIEDQP